MAIAIVIKEGCAATPMRIGSYAFHARLSKRSVAIISIEPICAEVRHINIGIPVVIVIAAGGTVAVTAFVTDTRLSR